MSDHNVQVNVNGVSLSGHVPARRTLLDFLRSDLGLTGTHAGCEHGVCGACTVILNGVAVRSCLLLAVQAEGAEVRTVEGVADGDGSLHAVQQALHESNALQCGFCTPGIVMTLVSMREAGADRHAMTQAMSGHLCRCTGYQGLLKAIDRLGTEPAESEGANNG